MGTNSCRKTLPMACSTRSSSAALPMTELTCAVDAVISASICRRRGSNGSALMMHLVTSETGAQRLLYRNPRKAARLRERLAVGMRRCRSAFDDSGRRQVEHQQHQIADTHAGDHAPEQIGVLGHQLRTARASAD